MKKELNRYYLTCYHGTRETYVDTYQEYEELLKSVDKYNNKNNPYLYGNITIEKCGNRYKVIAHVYDKLTQKSKLSDLLNYTSQFTKEELIMLLQSDTGTKEGYIPDFNIAYKNNVTNKYEDEDGTHYERKIKYLPVLYKDDKKYLSKEYIKKCFYYHAYERKDYNFFKGLAYELDPYHIVSDKIEKLRIEIDKVENQNADVKNMYLCALDLLDSYIVERTSEGVPDRDPEKYYISKRRLYDVGMYTKYYMTPDAKKHSPLIYNEYYTKEKRKELKEEQKLKLQKSIEDGTAIYEQTSLF